MAAEENNEETYSLIFRSLKHPIRRKILRMLRDEELTFSQILEILSIDSGHLSYHLENLGDLITHSPDGKYKLSSAGMAATKLMSGVEEHNPPTVIKPVGNVDKTVRIFSIVLAVILLWSSFYSVDFTTETTNPFVRVPKTDQRIPFALAPNEAYHYNITIIYGGLGLVSTEPNGLRIVTNKPSDTISEWRKYFLRLELEIDEPSNISLTVRDPSSAMISYNQLGGLGVIGIGPNVYFTQNGTYQVEIQNLESNSTHAAVAFEVMFEQFQRPLFYYGLAGVAAVLLYPLIVLASRFWAKKAKLAKVI